MIQQQVKNGFPTLDDVHAAAERLEGLVVKTPFVFSETISKTLGAEMWLKFENLQFTASFKERGALNKLLCLSEQEKQHGVIAASAGNHAQGVAYHAQRTGVTATIVMPKSTPNVKVQRVREYGARVILHGQDFSEAAAEMHRVAQEESLTIIHPFDDAEIIAGQKPHIDYNLIPGVVYTWPEVAAVGQTEEQLKASGVEFKSGSFPFKALGRARASGDLDGFVKILADAKTDEVLGVHMIGARTADLIAEAVTAMEFRASAEDISRMSHAHPTFAEAIKEAALAATDNRALHV